MSLKGDFFNDFLNEINGQLADQGRDKLSKSDFQNKKKKVILSLILNEKSTRQKDFTKIFPIMSIISLYNLKTILDYENCEIRLVHNLYHLFSLTGRARPYSTYKNTQKSRRFKLKSGF
ncbi:hypothetical protein GYN14_10740 [Lactococcus piscium]|uniref:hypothetical protein n=1 Tax=Pseudolactococcus carnosus TaxID=2749961 RepID=UPI001FBB9218|nr:hypothetical protein [Lactococcus carnosus]MCJ1992947.1 hypothetical protein [Lactococcus carnosus]